MAITQILSTAVSGLTVNAARVGAVAENVVNVNTPGYRSKDIRSSSVVTEQPPGNPVHAPAGIQGVVIEEDGPTELATQFTRLIRSRAAFSASAELLRTADELQKETVNLKA